MFDGQFGNKNIACFLQIFILISILFVVIVVAALAVVIVVACHDAVCKIS